MSGARDEFFTSKRSSTAVATLLTFCPPGPDARTKRSFNTRASTATVSESLIMVHEPDRFPPGTGDKRRSPVRHRLFAVD